MGRSLALCLLGSLGGFEANSFGGVEERAGLFERSLVNVVVSRRWADVGLRLRLCSP
jgi:hypothetical protein